MNRRNSGFAFFAALLILLASALCAGAKAKPTTAPLATADSTTQPGNIAARDYYTAQYKTYKPGFLPLRDLWFWENSPTDERSSEKNFNNFSILNEDSRVNAAIVVAQQREEAGNYREAQPLYQDIIEKMPDVLYRVSENGAFVRAADYCQMRLLAMPPADLAFYRTQYDARAADAFAEAERQYSLAGYQEIADSMLATSWGDKAMMTLGRAALDAGRYEEAYQRFSFVRSFFSGGHCDTPELAVLLAYAAKKCGMPPVALPSDSVTMAQGLAQMKAALPNVKPASREVALRSPPYTSGGDYGDASPVPTDTPLFTAPVWKSPLPSEWYTKEVYSSPVVTDDSVIVRHRNIVYCYSLLTGLLRWKNDIGGRVVWQNVHTLSFPNEEVVVSDNMVYTNIYKGAPSLVALSLTTGELRWAAGALASTGDNHMRYEAAPVVEGGVVYAGYVLDNIEGDAHVDTVYGLRAFDAKTGQLLWDRPISRLPPGKFTTNVGDVAHIAIRSFSTPPALKEGTLYYNTNAGTIAAIDSQTGRIKWLIRYPYYIKRAAIHDAVESPSPFVFRGGIEAFGAVDEHSSLWSCQPPLVFNDCLYVAPVDSPLLMAIEPATGKVRWSHLKGADDKNLNIVRNFLGPGYLLGPTKAGELVIVYGSRLTAATVINAATGKIDWEVPDVIPPEDSPALNESSAGLGGTLERTLQINRAQFQAAARPILLADDSVILSSFAYYTFGYIGKAFAYGTATLSIPDHKVVKEERYYDAAVLSAADTIIHDDAPSQLKFFTGVQAERLKRIIADHVPSNPAGVFKPAAIVTARRYGTVFEVRVAADEIAVAYDKNEVEQYLGQNQTAPLLQARAELAMAQSAYSDAAALLNECVAKTLPEQIAFQEKIGGLFHSLDLHLARKDLLRREYSDYITNAGLLLQTSQTLPQEIQSLLAVAEGYERSGDRVRAARILRNISEHFGTREYSVTPLLFEREMSRGLDALLDEVSAQMPARTYGPEFKTALSLAKNAAPLYVSAVSPAAATITVNVGSLALSRLRDLERTSPDVAAMLEGESRDAFAKAEEGEREGLLRAFPGTAAGQKALNELAATAENLPGIEGRRQAWRLADTAEAAGFALPDALKQGRPFAEKDTTRPAILPTTQSSQVTFEGEETLRLVLPRRDASNERSELLFIGGRARKRLDNRFTLECYDVRDGKKLWAAPDFRLKGIGQEPGFFEAFVHHQMVIVHGLFDVLAFDINNGHLLWHYRVPSDFEIGHVLLAGDLLVLAGDRGTLALYVPTTSAVGDVVWESKEEGSLYCAPYAEDDRLVLVRQSPDNVTVRHLGSGELVGRMDFPGLANSTLHPLLAAGAEAPPVAHAGNLLLLTDGWSYVLIDTATLSVRWKREIDSNDPAVVPPMRIALNDHVAVITKKDFDHGAMYGIDVTTGEVLWKTDPRNAKALPPLYDVYLNGDIACGITAPTNQTFRLVSFNPQTGAKLSEWKAPAYPAMPTVRMSPGGDGLNAILTILQGQKLQILAVDSKAGHIMSSVEREGAGPFGTHGFASAGAFDGRLVLLTSNGFSISGSQ